MAWLLARRVVGMAGCLGAGLLRWVFGAVCGRALPVAGCAVSPRSAARGAVGVDPAGACTAAVRADGELVPADAIFILVTTQYGFGRYWKRMPRVGRFAGW